MNLIVLSFAPHGTDRAGPCSCSRPMGVCFCIQLRATESNSLQGEHTPLTPSPTHGHRRASQHSLLDLRSAVHKLVVPEAVEGVLDELNEGDQQPPGVRAVDDQTLQEHPDQDSTGQGSP